MTKSVLFLALCFILCGCGVNSTEPTPVVVNPVTKAMDPGTPVQVLEGIYMDQTMIYERECVGTRNPDSSCDQLRESKNAFGDAIEVLRKVAAEKEAAASAQKNPKTGALFR